MLPRTLEPEVMDTREEAVDYDAMDHAAVNTAFVVDLLDAAARLDASTDFQDAARPPTGLDVGTGTAQIPIELCRRNNHCRVTAVDLAGEMLRVARENVDVAGMSDRIRLEQIDAKRTPFADASFDVVVSNSIVHHIPEPDAVFHEMVRVLAPGGLLFVRDLLRPTDVAVLEQLAETYTGNENAHQQQMFRDSLHAALTLDEVREILSRVGLPPDAASQTTDRHWTIAAKK